MKTKQDTSTEISVIKVQRQRVTYMVKGTSPLILHCMSEKAMRELLMPSPKKNKVERTTSLKHDPIAEYRSSANLSKDPNSPTHLLIPATAFKGALCGAALDVPGSATKAAIGRLTYVEGDYVPIYGMPMLHMGIVRMADMARTPDVRTRVIVPEWACELTISFATPILKEDVVSNLLVGAGITHGVGDFRTQKGKGNYGSFELTSKDDAKFKEIRKIGRKEQLKAYDNPECYDEETEKLLAWFTSEAKRREFKATGAA